MRPITVYEANDGTRFDDVQSALLRDRLLVDIAAIVAPLGPQVRDLPGNRYVQHDPSTVNAVRIALLRKAAEVSDHHWFPETIARAEAGEYVGGGWGVGRIIDEYGGPIARAWWRVCVIDAKGQEWNQQYYVANPPLNAAEWVR